MVNCNESQTRSFELTLSFSSQQDVCCQDVDSGMRYYILSLFGLSKANVVVQPTLLVSTALPSTSTRFLLGRLVRSIVVLLEILFLHLLMSSYRFELFR